MLFTQSPLVGHGLGSTEGLYTAVQPFFYESKFVHNHVLQFMSDTGLLGTVGFLTLILGVAWVLLKALQTEARPLASVLFACLVMMNAHSLMEINFSIRAFQCVAYVLLALMIICFAKPVSEKVLQIGGWVLGGCLWAYLSVFGALLMGHRSVQTDAANLATNDAYVYMNAMERFIGRDVFEQEDYKISYVANAMAFGEEAFHKNMLKYADDLRNSGTYSACSALARYYYLPQGNVAELFACSREGIAQEASTNDAWNFQFAFYRDEVLPEIEETEMDLFVQEVLKTKTYLEEYSEGRLEEIQLTEENKAFLDAAAVAVETKMPAIAAKEMLAAYTEVDS